MMQADAQIEPIAEPVNVTIPASAGFVSVARLVAAAVAARQAFTYDEIQDLKIAVSEACNALIAATNAPSRPITLYFIPDGAALAIRIEAQGATLDTTDTTAISEGRPRPLDERQLGVFLMQCLADEVEIRHAEGQSSIRLRVVRRRQEGQDVGL